ncbi:hypothetical protein [Streptomyces sp. E2N166]|uniref:hypothetical protein n=1 Tax=Streptomyces sp. E2N166 TaxID=1851909 RepID=UPI001EE8F44E|nr:hypothetical protein [Streptomyces sp. E2N166]
MAWSQFPSGSGSCLVLRDVILVDEFQRSWLLAQLGPDTDPADLERRFLRLRSVRAVALEVLGERRAKLLADPLKVTVDGVVTMDLHENLRGMERQIEQVRQAPAPDGTDDDEDGDESIAVTWLTAARRYR